MALSAAVLCLITIALPFAGGLVPTDTAAFYPADDPPTTSSCINISIPDTLQYGEQLVIEASVWSGTVNALAFDVDGENAVVDTTICSLSAFSATYGFDLLPYSYGTYNMTLIDWTDDPSCSLLVEHTISVHHPLIELNVSTLPNFAVKNETQLELTVLAFGGTGVTVHVDWGDGYTSTGSCIGASEFSVLIFDYTYEITGTFTVSPFAMDSRSYISAENQIISILERIYYLTLYGNSSVLTPPGTGIWKLAAGADQRPLENIECVWNMGTNYTDTTRNVVMINASMEHEITFSYGQVTDVGTQTIHVNCSNAVSSQNLTMDVVVVWDNVTLGELTCNSSTLWNHSITCQLTIVRFGTGACFEWDMGDGKPLITYRDGYCAAGVPDASTTYVQMSSTDTVITREYTYDGNYGVHTVTVRGFNLANNDTLSANVDVLEWPCQSPNVTVHVACLSTSVSTPIENRYGFIATATFAVDCMKSEQFTARWELLDSDQSVLSTLTNATQLISEPYALPAGSYVVSVTASLWSSYFNLSDKTVVVTTCVNVTWSDILTEIDGSSFINATFNETFQLSAYNLTYDLSIQSPTDKSGMIPQWRCKRSDETWPAQLPNQTDLIPYSGTNGGCFGDAGPGMLSFAAGLWDLNIDTGYLEPLISYDIQFVVQKDERSAYADVSFYVQQPLAPVVVVRCVENCNSHVRVETNLTLTAVCTDNCWSYVGPTLAYQWKLFIGGTSLSDPFTEVPGFDSIATGVSRSSVTVIGSSLLSARYYKLVVYTNTFKSATASTEYVLFASCPPSAGTCVVTPTSGLAVVELFTTKCTLWTNCLGIDNDRLTYSYYVASKNEKALLPMYSGANSTVNVFFPIGNEDENYQNQLTVIASNDANYTASLTVYPITVAPPVGRETEAYGGILSYLGTLDNPEDICKNVLTFYEAVHKPLADNTSVDSYLYPLANPYIAPSPFLRAENEEEEFTAPMSDEERREFLYKVNVTSALADVVIATPVTSLALLKQIPDVVMNLVAHPRLITRDTASELSQYMDSLADDRVKNLTADSSQQDRIDVAEGFLTSSIGLLSVADQLQNNGEPDDDGMPTTASHATAREVGRTVVSVMSKMSDLVAEKLEVGDPPVAIRQGKMTLHVEKKTASTVASEPVSSHIGSAEIRGQLDVHASTCVVSQTMMSTTNPYIEELSVRKINTPVISMSVKLCDDSKRRRRRAATAVGLSQGSSALLSINIPQASLGLWVNATPKSETEGIVSSEFNLTTPGSVPLVIRVVPGEPSRVIAFVRRHAAPTTTDYDWLLTSWDNADNYTLYVAADLTKDVSQIYVGVQSSDGCGSGPSCDALMYHVYVKEVSCREWISDQQEWIPDNCQTEVATPKSVRFRSNLMAGFGAGFVTPVNTIDFATVFDNLDQKLIDSVAVWTTIIAFFVIYIPFAVLARYFDKKDALKWTVQPLVDNYDEDEFQYVLHVHSGFKLSSGTKSKVFFRVNGTEGETGVRKLDDGFRQNFGRGEVSSFLMKCPEEIGTPLSLQIWHDNSGGREAGWYLGKVVLIDLQQKRWYMFLCDDWLAVNKSDGSIRRNLKPSNAFTAANNSSALVRSNMFHRAVDDHMWLSVGMRAKPSSFTRAQRLATCMATLFLAMITNCMFFRTADEQTLNSETITIGPISLTPQQISNSIFSSLIVFPPILLIAYFFSKSVPKSHSSDQYNDGVRESVAGGWRLTGHNGNKERRTLCNPLLPYWCTYIAWFLVALSILVSAFFTILYSFEWGRDKSIAWLTAFLLSFLESVIFIQPAKVIVVALVMSFVIKRDSEVVDYEDAFGKMKTVDHINLKGDDRDEYMTADEMAEAKHKADMDDKMKAMIREILFYVVLLFLLLIVINGQHDTNSFLQNTNIANLFKKNLDKDAYIRQGFYKWAHDVLIPNLYYTINYNSENTSSYEEGYIADTYSFRLGPPKLRQLRVNQDRCEAPGLMANVRCTNSYSDVTAERNNFILGWQPTTWMHGYNESVPWSLRTRLERAFLFTTTDHEYSFTGKITNYPAGGYVADLTEHADLATSLIQDLEANHWIDEYTRAVLVEFNVLNPNSKLFNQVVLLFEYTTDGSTLWTTSVHEVQLYRYAGSAGVVALLSEIGCAIFMVVITVLEVIKICRMRLRYFKGVWNVLQWTALVLFYVAALLYTLRSLWTVWVVEDLMNNPGKIVSFEPVVHYNDNYLVLIGIVAFITQLQLLHLLRYNRTISILGATLQHALWDLISFGFVMGIIFFAFTSAIYLMYHELAVYSTMVHAMGSQVEAMLGKFSLDTVISFGGQSAGLFLIIYLFTMMVMVMNFFVAILNDFLAAVANSKEMQNRDFEVMDHFLDTVKELVVSKTDNNGTKTRDAETTGRSVHDLSERIDCLEGIIERMIDESNKADDIDTCITYAVCSQ